ncbi:MAG: TIGR00180 family glycosyltransferase [Alphaproteobacteria bacterium]|nr:TIGR00180 family glycosyltransferase [Alphaproteobacteria bacterium]
MLDKLTLVIPTYKRHAFALRNMRFWSNTPVQLLVMDGSDEPISEAELASMGSNISYRHAAVGLVKRIEMALPLVQTEYVALYGDDEFFLKSGLEASIKFLDENPDYITCCGQALGFRPMKTEIQGFRRYKRLDGRDLDNSDGRDRMVRHMADYVPSHIYAVVRTEPWRNAIKCVADREFRALAISEVQVELCLSYAGKSRALPDVMWLRSYNETKPIRGTDPGLDDTKPLYVWWQGDETAKERAEFVERTAHALKAFDKDVKPDNHYKEAVVDACDAYATDVVNARKGLLQKAGQFLPTPTRVSIRNSYKFIKNKIKKKHSLFEFGEILKNSGCNVNIDEIREIDKVLKQFYNI